MIEIDRQTIMQWSRLGSRRTFGEIMDRIAADHDDMFAIAADLATSANLTQYAADHPDKFLDIGIAEQNMTGVAAGMAKEGFNVFITSFAPFASMRAFEAVRTLAGYMKLNVKVVALASGVAMEAHGNTHFGLEDLALMRTIPGMLVLNPADCTEVVKCVQALADYKGPAYLRLTGVPGAGTVYKEDYDFEIGKSIVVREGEDVAVIATGTMVGESIRAARALGKEGISLEIINAHTIKPFDYEMLDRVSSKYKMIVTCEEHNVIGGLGSIVAEHLSAKKEHPKLVRIGINDIFPKAGDFSYVIDECGLSAQKIVERIRESYN